MSSVLLWIGWWSAINAAAFAGVGAITFDTRRAGPAFGVVLGAIVTLAALAGGTLYLAPSESVLRQGLSLVLLALSSALFVGAWLSALGTPLGVIASAQGPTALIERGLYRSVRHPFYSSYLATFWAVAMAAAHWTPAACAAVATALYGGAAWLEERAFARSPLGGAYRAYRRQAGMFWPKRGRPLAQPRPWARGGLGR
jgi:protein-S-isoprenylcysteine O-methyltransferase Ste14